MNKDISEKPPTLPIPVKWVYLSLASYLPAAIGICLPAEKLIIANDTYSLSLWYQYSGQAVIGVLAFMCLMQVLVWQHKKHWMVWPGILAALHATAFATLRIVSLSMPASWPSNSLSQTVHQHTSASLGLYVLLAGGITIISIHTWLWKKRG